MKWIGKHIVRTLADFSEDVTFYQPVNNADPKISIGSSDDERLVIQVQYQGTTTQTAQVASFATFTESGTANDGRFHFSVDGTQILRIQDGGLDLRNSSGISIDGTDILTDSSGTATLSNIDALDATTIATFETAMEANLDTFGAQLTSAEGLATIGTITTGVWNGTRIASAYLDDDTAHLSGTQTFSGAKTFSAATTTFTSATADSPLVKILNTTDDDQAGRLMFEKLRDDDAVAVGQNLGEIWFTGQDSAQNTEDYAYIIGEIDVSTDGQESGELQFGVAGHDGSTRTAMRLTGGSEAAEVDAVIGLGTSSVTTIAGDLAVSGDDVTIYNAVNDSNPTISLGSSATDRLEIKATYNSGAQTLCDVDFTTYTASGSTNDGRFGFFVDEVQLLNIKDDGMTVYGNVYLNDASAYFSATDTTTSSATQGGKLILQSDDSAAMANDHRLGVIEFKGAEDGSNTRSIGARIQAIAREDWDGSNNDADLEFYTTDGTTESKVLTLDADKLATFSGAVTVTGALTCTTNLATDQQKHLAWFTLAGFGTGDGTNYEIPEIISTTDAPFEHDTSAGSDGLTAQTVQVMMRLGGLVAPRAGTLKKWYGWATTAGSQTANIGLFRVRPTRNDNTNLTPVLLDNVSYTALGNSKMEDFDETSFTDADIAVGDIIYTGIKCQSAKTTYFTSTLEIEWD